MEAVSNMIGGVNGVSEGDPSQGAPGQQPGQLQPFCPSNVGRRGSRPRSSYRRSDMLVSCEGNIIVITVACLVLLHVVTMTIILLLLYCYSQIWVETARINGGTRVASH